MSKTKGQNKLNLLSYIDRLVYPKNKELQQSRLEVEREPVMDGQAEAASTKVESNLFDYFLCWCSGSSIIEGPAQPQCNLDLVCDTIRMLWATNHAVVVCAHNPLVVIEFAPDVRTNKERTVDTPLTFQCCCQTGSIVEDANITLLNELRRLMEPNSTVLMFALRWADMDPDTFVYVAVNIDDVVYGHDIQPGMESLRITQSMPSLGCVPYFKYYANFWYCRSKALRELGRDDITKRVAKSIFKLQMYNSEVDGVEASIHAITDGTLVNVDLAHWLAHEIHSTQGGDLRTVLGQSKFQWWVCDDQLPNGGGLDRGGGFVDITKDPPGRVLELQLSPYEQTHTYILQLRPCSDGLATSHSGFSTLIVIFQVVRHKKTNRIVVLKTCTEPGCFTNGKLDVRAAAVALSQALSTFRLDAKCETLEYHTLMETADALQLWGQFDSTPLLPPPKHISVFSLD